MWWAWGGHARGIGSLWPGLGAAPQPPAGSAVGALCRIQFSVCLSVCLWALSGAVAPPECVAQPGAWGGCPRRPGQPGQPGQWSLVSQAQEAGAARCPPRRRSQPAAARTVLVLVDGGPAWHIHMYKGDHQTHSTAEFGAAQAWWWRASAPAQFGRRRVSPCLGLALGPGRHGTAAAPECGAPPGAGRAQPWEVRQGRRAAALPRRWQRYP